MGGIRLVIDGDHKKQGYHWFSEVCSMLVRQVGSWYVTGYVTFYVTSRSECIGIAENPRVEDV